MVYKDFGPESPSAKDFGFRNQIQRASISVMNNIAEGFERESGPDFARFLNIAKASCGEVRSMYYAAQDLNYLNETVANERRIHLRKLAGGIASLHRHLKK